MASGFRRWFCCNSRPPFEPSAAKQGLGTDGKPVPQGVALPTLIGSTGRRADQARIQELEDKLKAAEARTEAANRRATELEERQNQERQAAESEQRRIQELQAAAAAAEAEERAAAQRVEELEAALKIKPSSVIRRAFLLQPVDADTSSLAFVTDNNATGKERDHLEPDFDKEEPMLPRAVPVAKDDAERSAKVESHGLAMLDESSCVEIREVVEKAGKHFGAATAYLTFMDRTHQYVKFQWTSDQEEQQELLAQNMPKLVEHAGVQVHPATPQHCLYMPRKGMPCNYAVKNRRCFTMRNSGMDPTFADTVFGSAMPFYAGAPCITADGLATASLCIVDMKPRPGFSAADELRLEALAAKVSHHLDRICGDQARTEAPANAARPEAQRLPQAPFTTIKLPLSAISERGTGQSMTSTMREVRFDPDRFSPSQENSSQGESKVSTDQTTSSIPRLCSASTRAESQDASGSQHGVSSVSWPQHGISTVREDASGLPEPVFGIDGGGDPRGAQSIQGLSTARDGFDGFTDRPEPVYGISQPRDTQDASHMVEGIRTVRGPEDSPLEPFFGVSADCKPQQDDVTATETSDSYDDDDFDMIPDLELLDEVQRLLTETWRAKYTSDRYRRQGSKLVPAGARVLNVLRVRHAKRTWQYSEHKRAIKASRVSCNTLSSPEACSSFGQQVAGSVDPDINEQVCFHGTKLQDAESIAQNNFSLDRAGKNAGCMFGPGIYMAQHASKSDEYAVSGAGVFQGQQAMLICRAAAGKVLHVTEPADYSSAVLSGGFDSVCGNRQHVAGTFPELVFFKSEAVMPQFVVIYARVYDKGSSGSK